MKSDVLEGLLEETEVTSSTDNDQLDLRELLRVLSLVKWKTEHPYARHPGGYKRPDMRGAE
jgi:hypothetical protein